VIDTFARTLQQDLGYKYMNTDNLFRPCNYMFPQISQKKKIIIFLDVIDPPEAFSAPQNAKFCS
jgi:hypothetical protein